jgi:GT2 family glycosyltransferase
MSKPSEPRDTVSAVICAYADDRWEQLLAAVDSVAGQSVPPQEIIVVIDHNDRLLGRIARARPGVVSLANSGLRGLSAARNTGVVAARGSIVAFLDDDARADPGWLERLLTQYADPAVAAVGGRVDADWVAGRPAWFPPEFDWVVGCSYRGLPLEPQPVRNLIGANMSFRRSVFDAVGGFRSGIGRVGSRPVGCEETELCIRARRHDPAAIVLFDPHARVHHRVPPERAVWRYYRARCHAEGRSKAAVAALAGPTDALSSERAHVLRALPRGVARGIGDALVRGDAAGIGRALAIVAGLAITCIGYAQGRLLRRAGPSATGDRIALTPDYAGT